MLNRACLIGHAGADPETGLTSSGKKWAKLRIATTEKWTDKATGEKKERTEWHTIAIWGDELIDKVVVPYIKKGSKLYIEGQIQTQEYEDTTTIQGHTIKRWSTRIAVQGLDGMIKLLDKADRRDNAPMTEPEGRMSGTEGRANGTPSPATNGAAPPAGGKPFADEIPF